MSNFTLHRRAEWLPHSRIIMGWPGLNGVIKDYPDRLAIVTQELANVTAAVAQFEPVTLVVGAEREADAHTFFATTQTKYPVTVHAIAGDSMDFWLRDFGPTFVIKNGPNGDHSLVGLDYNFNGWGGKHGSPTTEIFTETYLRDFGIPRIQTSIVTEGGAIETDGDGTLLVTESSIINENRNPGKSKQEIEAELKRTLGVEKVIWIPGRKNIDSTDCHIDALVRFARPGLVLLSKAHPKERPEWIRIYEEALEILRRETDAKGRPLHIIEIEEPDPDLFPGGGFEEDPPVRSYVNYLLVNGGIILARFGDLPHDAAAIKAVQRAFGPERQVWPVYIDEIPRQGGGIHCITQEVPKFP